MKTNRPVTLRQEQQHERALCTAILALRSVEECRSFFRDLCTPAELQAMADRWAVVELLERGLPYREIHRQTGVSVTTIGRVARYLTSGKRRLPGRDRAAEAQWRERHEFPRSDAPEDRRAKERPAHRQLARPACRAAASNSAAARTS